MSAKKKFASSDIYDIHIEGRSPLLMNKILGMGIPKAELKDQTKEDPIIKERRIWRDKMYTDADGNVIMPMENIYKCLVEGARAWGQKIPGMGNSKYAGIIERSLIVIDHMHLGFKQDDEKHIEAYGAPCNGNPSKGKMSGAKVWKIRPRIRIPWGGVIRVCASDPLITLDVLENVAAKAGEVGIGDYRQLYGKFVLKDIQAVALKDAI